MIRRILDCILTVLWDRHATASVLVSLHKTGPVVELIIKHSGPGILPEFQRTFGGAVVTIGL